MIHALRTGRRRSFQTSSKSTIPLPVLITLALDGINHARRANQLLAEELRIGLHQAEDAREDASLVPPARMKWAKAVISQLGDTPRRHAQLRAASSRLSVTDRRS